MPEAQRSQVQSLESPQARSVKEGGYRERKFTDIFRKKKRKKEKVCFYNLRIIEDYS